MDEIMQRIQLKLLTVDLLSLSELERTAVERVLAVAKLSTSEAGFVSVMTTMIRTATNAEFARHLEKYTQLALRK